MLRVNHDTGVGDEIDAAIATEQAELHSQMASFESRELAQIEHALDKIRAGHYGRCEVCDKSIAPVRLNAAALCDGVHQLALAATNGAVLPQAGCAERCRPLDPREPHRGIHGG